MKRLATLALALLPLLASLSCGSDKGTFSEGSSSPTATSAPATATPPLSTATPPGQAGFLEVPSTVWLVDARGGARSTLHEDRTAFPGARFGMQQGTVVLSYPGAAPEEVILSFQGAELSRGAYEAACKTVDGAAEVKGRRYAGVACGSISPDGRWMLYQVPAGETEVQPGYRVPVWDEWLLDLTAGRRAELQRGLRHCGGCDGRFGPAWSPTSRYVYFSELISDGGRVFLTDTATLTARNITDVNHATQLSQEPSWSPDADLLLRPAADGSTHLEDLPTGRSLHLPDVSWPARFDASGRYLYSPAWDTVPAKSEGERTTTIFDARTLTAVASLSGAPNYNRLFVGGPSVAARGDSFVAVLEKSVHCAGAAVYAGSDLLTCIDKAGGASISPDGRLVALTRVTGQTGPVKSPGIQAVSLYQFEVVLIDVETGRKQVVAQGAISERNPDIAWNPESTHFLVRWPAWSGL